MVAGFLLLVATAAAYVLAIPGDRLKATAETLHTPTHASADPNERPVIACFGDSLTAGYGVDMEQSYPSVLQHDLDRSGYQYRVVNYGISGETTKDGLARVDRVIARHPAIAVVEFGGNDGLRGVPVSITRANLDAIVGKLTHAGIQVALAGITLPPQYSQPYIHQFNAMYPEIARKYHVPLLPFILKDVYGIPGSIQGDGVHPTAQGCRQVARNIETLLKPLLAKREAANFHKG